MIELLEDMPEGTIGFRATGEVTADDYRQVLEPAVKKAVEAGEVRMLYMLDGDFKLSAGASLQDTRTGIVAYIHHSEWKKSAIVTDAEWLVKSMHAFGWMVPGELEVFPVAELDKAKEWLSAGSDS